MANEDVDLELGDTKEGGSKMMIIIIAVVVLLAGAGGAMFFMKLGPFAEPEAEVVEGAEGAQESSEVAATEAVPKGPAIYHSMEEAMVVNLSDTGRPKYLRVRIQFMMFDEMVIEDLDLHMPVLKNDLYSLIGDKTSKEMRSSADKNLLRQEVLDKVKEILLERTGKEGVEDIFFDIFVIQ